MKKVEILFEQEEWMTFKELEPMIIAFLEANHPNQVKNLHNIQGVHYHWVPNEDAIDIYTRNRYKMIEIEEWYAKINEEKSNS